MKRIIYNLTASLLATLFISSLQAVEMQENKVDESLSVAVAVAPTYPPIALAAGIVGEVKVEVSIKTDGTVSSTKIISGHRLLREGCEDAAREWFFVQSKGSSENHTATLTFAFFTATPQTVNRKLTTIFKLPTRIEITRRMNSVITPQIRSKRR